jgi:hypothetical protein
MEESIGEGPGGRVEGSVDPPELTRRGSGGYCAFSGAGFDRGVAQPGSAPALGAGGRRFKSSRPDSNPAPDPPAFDHPPESPIPHMAPKDTYVPPYG